MGNFLRLVARDTLFYPAIVIFKWRSNGHMCFWPSSSSIKTDGNTVVGGPSCDAVHRHEGSEVLAPIRVVVIVRLHVRNGYAMKLKLIFPPPLATTARRILFLVPRPLLMQWSRHFVTPVALLLHQDRQRRALDGGWLLDFFRRQLCDIRRPARRTIPSCDVDDAPCRPQALCEPRAPKQAEESSNSATRRPHHGPTGAKRA